LAKELGKSAWGKMLGKMPREINKARCGRRDTCTKKEGEIRAQKSTPRT
jgi:hypothetical protein